MIVYVRFHSFLATELVELRIGKVSPRRKPITPASETMARYPNSEFHLSSLTDKKSKFYAKKTRARLPQKQLTFIRWTVRWVDLKQKDMKRTQQLYSRNDPCDVSRRKPKKKIQRILLNSLQHKIQQARTQKARSATNSIFWKIKISEYIKKIN